VAEPSAAENPPDKVPSMFIKNTSELADIVARRQSAGEKIVFTNGVFDLLHVGHVRYLRQARALGDALLIAVNSDESTKRLKGPTRPLVTEDERAEILDQLKCVDYVTLFSTDTPVPLIEIVRPAIYVKGGDYDIEKIPETAVVRSYGGEVAILGFTEGRSTSRLVELMSGSR
jgi:rfaE bifunctional protein nucleotidyltransferase chain/domain